MLEREKMIKLYDIYNELLTNIQKKYFEYYYFEDLSLNEIAEIMQVSKSFVGKTINKVEEKLTMLENKLKIYNLHKNINEIIKETKDSKIAEKLENLIK